MGRLDNLDYDELLLRAGEYLTAIPADEAASTYGRAVVPDADHAWLHARAVEILDEYGIGEPDDGPVGQLDYHELALYAALCDLDAHTRAAGPDFNKKHPRGPGGRFATIADRIKEAVEKHLKGDGDGDPFEGFDREQLRKVAKARGIELKRGEDRDSIAKKLLANLGPGKTGAHTKKKAVSASDAQRLDRVTRFAERLDHAVSGGDAIAAAPYHYRGRGPARNGVAADDIDGAIEFYRSAGYMGVNGNLRDDRKGQPWDSAIELLDAGMGPLASDVVVWRGVKKPEKVFGDAWNDTDVAGLEWRDAGFSSSSADEALSLGGSFFTATTGVVMRILAPRGTRALGMSDSHETELLLDRGLRFRVVADHGVTARNGLRHLDVEVVA